MMRILPNLLLILIVVALGAPSVVPAGEGGNGCAIGMELDAGAGSPCGSTDGGIDMNCGPVGGTCQMPAVSPFDSVVPTGSTEIDHPLPALVPYRSPDLSGLFRPPITLAA